MLRRAETTEQAEEGVWGCAVRVNSPPFCLSACAPIRRADTPRELRDEQIPSSRLKPTLMSTTRTEIERTFRRERTAQLSRGRIEVGSSDRNYQRRPDVTAILGPRDRQRSRQTVELPDNNDVPLAQPIEHAMQRGTVPAAVGCGFLEDTLAARRLQCLQLQRI